MSEKIIEYILSGNLQSDLLLKWLNCENIEDAPEDCILHCSSRSEFVAYFLTFLRKHTEAILQTNTSALPALQQQQTPDKFLHPRRKHRRSISDPTNETDRTSENNRSHESPNRDKKRIGKRVKTKLFPDDKNLSVSSDESRINTSFDKLTLSSTPLKNGVSSPNFATSPVTPQSRNVLTERCDTPRLHRHSRSHDKSVSLGDYIINAQAKSGKKKRQSKNASSETEELKVDLDISNSEMFPEIGARKSSSLKSDRRRIKPTNIDTGVTRKSFSLTSFNTECFQTYSPLALEENNFFKPQDVAPRESSSGFEVERNILKQERHKLMEKFNILNTATSPKTSTPPLIKISKRDSIEKSQSFIKTDASKVTYKKKIDSLVDIYDVLIKNNLVLSVVTEIYFLISIILSEQFEDDYMSIESQISDNNCNEFLLKSINNCTYFAVKSLWHQRLILEVILDKGSLKILGENKKVRSFYPELAKSLLNSYGLKCEAESSQDKNKMLLENRGSNGIVCFNFETDNVDNFPTTLSFQNFKKQRDMFYEIVRWYHSSQSSLVSLRARTKALLCCGATSTNVQRLAALFTTHMLGDCVETDAQESKLSKLQRRLTCPSAIESHRLPHFTGKEVFYKEFILCTDNESFRAHLTDAFASEIIALDGAHFSTDDKANTVETSREFLYLSKKLTLLSKFLGFVTSLPYCQVSAELTAKCQASNVGGHLTSVAPKEKVLENDLALRNYRQPCVDVKGLLESALQNGRLVITLPWIVQYLSMLDYTTLRIKYYQNILRTLFEIYTNMLNFESAELKKNTVLFLKIKLGWLYDLPQVPHDFAHEKKTHASNVTAVSVSDATVDSLDLIGESILAELCPHLRDISVLLSTCRVASEQKEITFRHITPVSLSLNDEDRVKNKEKEIQARLEEELLKSQPSSTRKVLELVIERVTSSTIRELTVTSLAQARERAREKAVSLISSQGNKDQVALVQALQTLFNAEISELHNNCMSIADSTMKSRISRAVQALLPAASAPLLCVANKRAKSRLSAWLRSHWANTTLLCGDIEQFIRSVTPDHPQSTVSTVSKRESTKKELSPATFANHVSVASTVIQLKEQICLLLERRSTPSLSTILSTTRAAVHPNNPYCIKAARNALLQLSVDLCIVFVSRRPQEVTEEFLLQLHQIWDTICPERKKNSPQDIELLLPERREISPELRNFDDTDRAATPISDDEIQPIKNVIILKTDVQTANQNKLSNPTGSTMNQSSVSSLNQSSASLDQSAVSLNKSSSSINISALDCCENSEFLDYFDRILCPRNIMLLSDCKCLNEVWTSMASVLVFLLKHDYLSEDSLTEQCLAVYRQDWPQHILESLSTCMRLVSSRWSHSAGKFTLFLDFLAEYCGDMDYEPV